MHLYTPTSPIQQPISPATLIDAIHGIDSDKKTDFLSLETRIGYDGLLLLLQIAREYVALIKSHGYCPPLDTNAMIFLKELKGYLNQSES